MPDIRINLFDGTSLGQAIDKLKEYQKRVEKADAKMVDRLTRDGAETASELVEYMNAIDTGELQGSIYPEVRGREGTIYAGTDHCAFVEFGTGVVGVRSPHPAGSWVYDINAHGDKGWWYRGDDGKPHWTKGMESRPYMWDTAQMLRKAIPMVGEEAVKLDQP